MSRWFRWLWDLCWLVRLTVLVPIGFACSCSAVLCGMEVHHMKTLLLTTAIILLAGGGFVLNDINDKEKDCIAHSERPLPSGRISQSTAWLVCLFLFACSVCCGLSLRSTVVNMQLAAALALVVSYSSVVKWAGPLKNIVTAGLAALPWTGPAALSGNWTSAAIPAVGSVLLVLSREILLDIRDVESDRIAGVRTLPVLLGCKKAAWLSALLLLLVFLAIQGFGIIEGYGPTFTTTVAIGIGLPTVLICWVLLRARRSKYLTLACHLGKLQFVGGTFAWLLRAY